MEIPQQTDHATNRLLQELTRKVDDLANAQRFNNLQDSPTVRVVKTAVGATLHSTPAPVQQQASASAWVWP